MLEIWGRKNSSNVIPVMWAVGELGLEHTRYNVGGSFGGLDTADFRAKNPKGLIPVINDDEFILTESNAIVRYLCTLYGNELLPLKDARAYAIADQWMEWYKTTAYGPYIGLFKMLIRTPVEKQDSAEASRYQNTLESHLKLLDSQLCGQNYVGGNDFSMADIPLGSLAYRYFNLEIERADLPNLAAWYVRLCERPAFQEHAMIPFGRNLEEWNELEKNTNH